MIKVSLVMPHNNEEVYDFIIKLFTDQFKISPERLLNHRYQTTMKYMKSFIPVEQRVSELIENERIEFVSQYGEQMIQSTYWLERQGENKTKVTLSEEGTSNKKTIDLNYKLFSFPLVNSSAKKKLKMRLYQINQSLKSAKEGDVE
ncbi:MAG: DUF3284 domain-containing protein [Erysipelothrix sp.]|nr:DUF3284 domain-containing protein [Erysipelothrix sp.]